LSKMQNFYFRFGQEVYSRYSRAAKKGEDAARAWIGRFDSLGSLLRCQPDWKR